MGDLAQSGTGLGRGIHMVRFSRIHPPSIHAEFENTLIQIFPINVVGQQRYGANVWTGDVGSSWETLRNQVPAGLNFCVANLPEGPHTGLGIQILGRGIHMVRFSRIHPPSVHPHPFGVCGTAALRG